VQTCALRIYAGLIDQESLGYAVDAVVDADAPVAIDDRRGIRIAVLNEPGTAVVGFVLVVETVHGNDLRLGELDEQRMLDAARYAPRRPDVEKPDGALEVGRR